MPIFLEVRNKSPAFLPLKPLRYITFFWLFYSLSPRYQDSHILAWSSSGNVAQLVANLGNGPTLSILPSWAQSRQNRDYISQPYLQVGVAMWLLLNRRKPCATSASFQEAAYVPFLFPTFDWLGNGNQLMPRNLLAPWDDIYLLRKQSQLRSPATKITSWSNPA